MSKRTNRTYTKEFKLEALALYQSSGKSSYQIERELGITRGLLLKWRDRYQVEVENGETQLVPSELESAKTEILRLRRELRIAQEEREILKKAVNIFSQRSG